MTHAGEVLEDFVKQITTQDQEEEGAETSSPASLLKEYPPFASNVQGRPIRHAITGAYYDHLVGSRHEHLYFKVCDAVRGDRRDSDTYFYDSPQDYMKLKNVELPASVISQWVDTRARVTV